MAQAVAPNATGISRGVVNRQLSATLLTTRTRSVAVISHPFSCSYQSPVQLQYQVTARPIQLQLQRPSQDRSINRSAPHVKQHQVHFLDVCADIGWDRNDVIRVRAPQSILTA